MFHTWRQAEPDGAIGVDVFFVLSGFLITTLLLDEWKQSGTIRLRAFYVRRAGRLLPALAVVLLASILWSALTRSPASAGTGAGAVFAATYSTDLALAAHPATPLGPLGPTWSLSVEEQFYALWPLLLLGLLVRGGPRRLLLGALVGACLAIGLRVMLSAGGASFGRMYFAADTRADQLLIGAALAAARGAGLLRLVPHAVIRLLACSGWAYLALAACIPGSVPGVLPWGFTLVAVASALAIWGVIGPTQTGARALSARPLVYVGSISYGIYLWHLPLQAMLLDRFGLSSGPWDAAALLVASGMVASASHRFVELPCRLWTRDWLQRRRVASPLPLRVA